MNSISRFIHRDREIYSSLKTFNIMWFGLVHCRVFVLLLLVRCSVGVSTRSLDSRPETPRDTTNESTMGSAIVSKCYIRRWPHRSLDSEVRSRRDSAFGETEHVTEISRDDAGLTQRRGTITITRNVMFDYSCSILPRMNQLFVFKVQYQHSTRNVQITAFRNIRYISDQSHEGYDPIFYDGILHGSNCFRFPDRHVDCQLHFQGYIQGEVYPAQNVISAEFLADLDTEEFEPTVTMQCWQTIGGRRIQFGQLEDCVVHNVDTYAPPSDHGI